MTTQCREKGDTQCASRLLGFVDYVDDDGNKTGGQLFECVTCGRQFASGKGEIRGPQQIEEKLDP